MLSQGSSEPAWYRVNRLLLIHLDLNFNSNQIIKDYKLLHTLVALSTSIYFAFRTNHGPMAKPMMTSQSTKGKNAEAPIDNEVAWVAASPKGNDIAVEESTPPRYCC